MPLNPTGALTQYRTQIDQNENDIATLDTQVGGLIVESEEVFRAVSYNDQEPAGLDTPLQLTFGTGQSTPEFDLDANGNLTVLQSGNYQGVLRLVFGRVGAGGFSNLFARVLINGFQPLASVHAVLDNSRASSSALFESTLDLVAGQVITVEILRSSADGGNDSGGVYAEPSPLAGWQASPSCSVVLNRLKVTLGS
jgi:hypothetical protein